MKENYEKEIMQLQKQWQLEKEQLSNEVEELKKKHKEELFGLYADFEESKKQVFQLREKEATYEAKLKKDAELSMEIENIEEEPRSRVPRPRNNSQRKILDEDDEEEDETSEEYIGEYMPKRNTQEEQEE